MSPTSRPFYLAVVVLLFHHPFSFSPCCHFSSPSYLWWLWSGYDLTVKSRVSSLPEPMVRHFTLSTPTPGHAPFVCLFCLPAVVGHHPRNGGVGSHQTVYLRGFLYLICQNMLEREEEERPLLWGKQGKDGESRGRKEGRKGRPGYQEVDRWKASQRREGERWEDKWWGGREDEGDRGKVGNDLRKGEHERKEDI